MKLEMVLFFAFRFFGSLKILIPYEILCEFLRYRYRNIYRYIYFNRYRNDASNQLNNQYFNS